MRGDVEAALDYTIGTNDASALHTIPSESW